MKYVLGILLLVMLNTAGAKNVPLNVPYKLPHGGQKEKIPGRVIATTTKYNLYRCKKNGITMVQLRASKRIVILCGIWKKVGQSITIAVDNPSEVDI